MNVLITSSSFHEVEGEHKDLLNQYGWQVDYLLGPLKENQLLTLGKSYDGIICGDDEFSAPVLGKLALEGLRGISKYGIGLDKINLKTAGSLLLPIRNCEAVNKRAVAEHTLALVLSGLKNLNEHYKNIEGKKWKRFAGRELSSSKVGIIGYGSIGQELAQMLSFFECEILVYDPFVEISENTMVKRSSLEEVLKTCSIITLHAPLNEGTRNMINHTNIKDMRSDAILVNTSRSNLVVKEAIIEALNNNIFQLYMTDVLDQEPYLFDDEYYRHDKILVTPHVASRTHENVVKQGIMAVKNLNEIFKL